MLVLCPSCATEYQIPELQRARKLRCTRCATEWRVSPDTAPEPEPPEVETGVPPEPRTPEPPPPEPARVAILARMAARQTESRTDLMLALLWIASFLVILGALLALWHWRLPIARHWPASQRLLGLLPGGLPRLRAGG